MTVISYVKPPALGLQKNLERTGELAAATIFYSLKLINNSATPWDFYVYQQVPNQQSAKVFSLAWFCSPFKIFPKAHITFHWTIDYTFVWGQTGTIQPGVTFSAGQTIDAESSIRSTPRPFPPGGYNMTAAVMGPPQGSLVINDAANVPSGQFSVGIGMGDAGTFVTAAAESASYVYADPDLLDCRRHGRQDWHDPRHHHGYPEPSGSFPIGVNNASYTLGANNQWAPS